MNIYNKSSQDNNQHIYDALNTLIISKDNNIFFKLVTRINLYNKVKDLPGDVVECGVFKGCGLITWLKLVKLYSPHSNKKVIGFDFFDPSFTENLEKENDKKFMKDVLARSKDTSEISIENIQEKILNSGFTKNNFQLVKGDISVTAKKYAKERIGFRISLLYMDLDLDEPTYNTLNSFWDKMTPGGIIVFDEYAYHIWSESNAVDRFIKEKNIELHSLNVASPTAYVIKK